MWAFRFKLQYCDKNFFLFNNSRRHFQWISIYCLAFLPLLLAEWYTHFSTLYDHPLSCPVKDFKRVNESLFDCVRSDSSEKSNVYDFNRIDTLIIRDSDLTMLSDVIEQRPSVKYIDIINLNVSSIDSLGIRDCSHLETIDLSKNKFKKLPSYLFANCRILSKLSLAKNEINELPLDTFSALSSLKVLSLAFNQITVLDRNIFRPLINLHELDLSHNRVCK